MGDRHSHHRRNLKRLRTENVRSWVTVDIPRCGPKGRRACVGRITGRVSGSDLQVTLNVRPTGEIQAFQGPKPGHIQAQFTSPSKLSVLVADRAQYEALILEFIEKAAGPK
jgi:hypothetical protein